MQGKAGVPVVFIFSTSEDLRSYRDTATRAVFYPDSSARMPDETVIGEVLAVDESGRPSFSALQHNDTARLLYYVVDVMILDGRDVTNETLTERDCGRCYRADALWRSTASGSTPPTIREISPDRCRLS